ncbi:hypothetical protein DSUL_80023 [Desulfovibrionales bacterium]
MALFSQKIRYENNNNLRIIHIKAQKNQNARLYMTPGHI